MSSVYEKPLRGAAKYSSGKVDMELDANSHRLVQMMYQAILEKIAIMKGAIDRNDQVAKSQLNAKLQLLLVELRKSIDFDLGGEISLNLDNLYEYSGRLIAEANAGNNKNKLDEVSSLITIVKESWDKIEDQAAEILEEHSKKLEEEAKKLAENSKENEETAD